MRAYLRSMVWEWAVAGFGAALIAFVLAAAGVGTAVICVVLAIGLMVEILVTVVRYARRREFYAELEEYTDETACPLWTAEMVDRPSFWEGRSSMTRCRRSPSRQTMGSRRLSVS